MSNITFRVNIVDKISNKQDDNMVYCQAEGCSSYFYKIEGSNYETCFHCRRK